MSNLKFLITTGLLSASMAALATAGGLPNKDNWNNHPEIREVRMVVKEVQEGINQKRFSEKSKHFEYCEPYQDTKRIIFLAKDNTPRKYYYEAGSDDSALRWDLYYDSKGRLRFAFIRGGAANSTEIEHRIYLNAKGQRVWEFQKRIKGPGYTFPTGKWPEESVGFNPVQQFGLSNKCPEKK